MKWNIVTGALRTSVSTRALILALSGTALAAGSASAGGTLPTSGQYIAGKGTIAKSGSKGLTIDQSSASGIIDWKSFSIGKKSSVDFNNGSGATLNRVTGGNLSSIAGSLHATGSVYVINSAGVMVGKTGRIDTGGTFAASSGDTSDSSFTGGDKKLRFHGATSGVSNAGSISSRSGDVILIGNTVSNSGSLSAAHGTAALNAARNVYLAPAGTTGQILVSGGHGNATNSGTIAAAQAQINAAGGNVYALGGNNGGIIRATGSKTESGHVWLTSGTGNITASGKISARNTDGSGGDVTLRGNNIASTGTIDASATKTSKAGGDISIVAENATKLDGLLKAEGSKNSRGGQIETSGGDVSIGGQIHAGKGGSWLIDPYDLTVGSSAASTISNTLNDGTDVSLQTTSGSATGPGTSNLAGNGDIFINSAIHWNSGATLQMSAYRNIDINAKITISGSGLLSMTTGTGTTGDYYLSEGATIDFGATDNGGALTINGNGYNLIYNMTDLQNMNSNLSGNYALATSLDATSTSDWVPIGSNDFGGFSGAFDGLGHTISNLVVNTPTEDEVGLFGDAEGDIRNIGVVGGAFAGDEDVGGLAGYNEGNIRNSYSTASVSGLLNIGGLVGEAFQSEISQSYSVGSVSGQGAIGGLIGHLESSTITNIYATGSVIGVGTQYVEYIGGLVGESQGNTISNAYALGTLRRGASTQADLGGLLGYGSNDTLSSVTWDTQTTGTFTGVGSSQNSGLAGSTTAQLQNHLPSGFDTSVWATGKGLLPYLQWQFNGTPEAVTGTVYSDFGTTPIGAAIMSLLVNGKTLGSVSSGANGYYYFVMPSSSIPSSNGQVLVYDAQDDEAAFQDNADGSFSGLKVFGGYLSEFTTQKTYSALAKDLATALGDASFPTAGLAIFATGKSFNIDKSIKFKSGDVHLVVSGPITQSGKGVIEAHSLSGTADGAVALTLANEISLLDAFSVTGNNDFAFTDAHDLTVSGAIDAGTGDIALTTTGSGHDLTINDELSAGTAKLKSAATIKQGKEGKIAATTLSGSAKGTVALTGANAVASLGAFSTDNHNFAFTDAHDLALAGAVDAGKHGLKLKTTGSGHDIAINSTLTGSAVALISAATISEGTSHGKITATTLTGVSKSKTTLSSANAFTNLGAFSTDGHNLAITDAHDLTVTGTANAGSQNIALTTIGAGHDITINGSLKGATDTLVSAAEILEGAKGSVTATKLLNVTAQTGIDLDSTHNHIKKVGTRKTKTGPNVIKGIGA